MIEDDSEFGDLCRLYWGEPGPYPHLSAAQLLALTHELQPDHDARCWNLLLDELSRRFAGRERKGRLLIEGPDGVMRLLPRAKVVLGPQVQATPR